MAKKAQPARVLRRFDEDSLKATVAEWQKQLTRMSGAIFPVAYDQVLSWAAKHMDYAKGENFSYGVFSDGSHAAEGIVDVIYTRTGNKWLKMMNLTLSPEHDVAFSTQSLDFDTLTSLFTAAIVGTFELSLEHKAKVVKLFGRTNVMLAFLTGLAAVMTERLKESSAPKLKVSIEGRWLVAKNV